MASRRSGGAAVVGGGSGCSAASGGAAAVGGGSGCSAASGCSGEEASNRTKVTRHSAAMHAASRRSGNLSRSIDQAGMRDSIAAPSAPSLINGRHPLRIRCGQPG